MKTYLALIVLTLLLACGCGQQDVKRESHVLGKNRAVVEMSITGTGRKLVLGDSLDEQFAAWTRTAGGFRSGGPGWSEAGLPPDG